MGDSLLVTTEETAFLPVLIVDREGSIGLGLCEKLRHQTQVVFVSNRVPEESKNVLHLPFTEPMPDMPEDQYSHIFYILTDEKKETDVLSACMKKAQYDGSFFSIIVEKRKVSSRVISSLSRGLIYGFVAVVGDLFNIPVLKKHAFVIERLFKEAKKTQKLLLPNMGLVKVYPIAYLDVIDLLLQYAFMSRKKTTVINLYPKFAVTELGVARAMQKANPSLTIDFQSDGQKENEEAEGSEGEFVLPENYPVFDLLQKAFEEFLGTLTEQTETREVETFSSPLLPHASPKKNRPYVLLFVGFFLTLILLPLLVTFSALQIGKLFLLSAKNQGLSGQFSEANSSIIAAEDSFAISDEANSVFSLEAVIPPFSSWSLSWGGESLSGKLLASGAENLITSALTVENVVRGKSMSSEEDIKAAVQQFRNGYAQLQAVATSSFLPKDTNTHLTDVLQAITPVVNVSEILPSALALTEQKTYLILFQNNAELRPGGGFIGSYGLLTMDNGKVKDFSIHDVYDADGQLKGHVEPPFPIRRYMGTVHLYLRDSNFDVDFSKNAFLAAQMLHLETGQTVDGVIGVDLSFVKNILSVVGPLELVDFNQTVTADNFFILTETHAEKDFFPGSTQKKDFLSSVFAALKDKINSNTAYEKVAQSVLASIKEKHVLFASANASEQDVLTANNLSSTLWDPRPSGEINDFLGISEANIGVNKVNYYVDRSVEQHATLTASGDIEGNTTLTVVNKSTSKDVYTGEYRSYVRFILPDSANVTGISIDGQDQSIIPAVTDFLVYEKKTFTPPIGLEVDKTLEQGKALYGFFIPVEQQGSRKITVSYIIKQAVNPSSTTATYSLKFFKQPGTDTYPYIFSFVYPDTYQVISTSDNLEKKQNYVSYNSTVNSDTTFSIYLGKK